MKQLKSKKALVTGAAGGIGSAIAIRLASEGMSVALVDCNPFGLEQVRREVESHGVESRVYVCDVTKSEEIREVTSDLLDEWAGVDVLVNNAGITHHGYVHLMSEEKWDQILAVNLNSHLHFTNQLLISMLTRPEAHVINMCSLLGLAGMPHVTAYCTTKFALVGFSESLRAEYARCGLGVTAVCPGFVDTGLFASEKSKVDGMPTKAPSKWMCTTPERVADYTIKAIKRNQPRVTIDRFGGLLYYAKRSLPGLFDFLLTLGRSKRVAKQRELLRDYAYDEVEAVRLVLKSHKAVAEEEQSNLKRAA